MRKGASVPRPKLLSTRPPAKGVTGLCRVRAAAALIWVKGGWDLVMARRSYEDTIRPARTTAGAAAYRPQFRSKASYVMILAIPQRLRFFSVSPDRPLAQLASSMGPASLHQLPHRVRPQDLAFVSY